MWTVVAPLLIELIREWIKEGKPSKAKVKVTVEAFLSQIEKMGPWDLNTLGKNMVIQGLAFQQMAKNLKPSEYKIQPLRPTSKGDVDKLL